MNGHIRPRSIRALHAARLATARARRVATVRAAVEAVLAERGYRPLEIRQTAPPDFWQARFVPAAGPEDDVYDEAAGGSAALLAQLRRYPVRCAGGVLVNRLLITNAIIHSARAGFAALGEFTRPDTARMAALVDELSV